MQPGVLLPDPVWNLSVCRLAGFADAHACREIAAEERERPPTVPIPKTMKVRFSRFLWENSALWSLQTQPMIVNPLARKSSKTLIILEG